jgi:predicted lipoprotein with Yx(FWY)xxD motif
MKLRFLTVALVAGGTLLAACGGDDDIASGASPVTAAPVTVAPATIAPASVAPSVAPSVDTIAVRRGESDLGELLTGPDGRTLYGFTQDTPGVSTCNGTCAAQWPPLIVSPAWTVGPELDQGIFSTIVRDDGQEQLVAGKWPLYYYAGDSVPGDTTGQGSGDVWFAVDVDGRLFQDGEAPADAAEAPVDVAGDGASGVSVAQTSLGHALVDGEGRTLYAFTDDEAGTPTCVDGCANAWPPLLADDVPGPIEGVPDGTFSVVARPDGSNQLKAGKWPLYTFSGDEAPGDVNGQGSGDVWFAVAPDGKLIK